MTTTRFVGTLVHDHNTVYYHYGTAHGECNVHLVRYLRANSDNVLNHWSDEMIELLLTMKRSKEHAIAYGADHFEQVDLDRYRKRYDEIVEAGFAALINTNSRFYKTEERRLLNRLKKYRDNHLLFAAADFSVPFDNNLSERDLRMVKTKGESLGVFQEFTRRTNLCQLNEYH